MGKFWIKKNGVKKLADIKNLVEKMYTDFSTILGGGHFRQSSFNLIFRPVMGIPLIPQTNDVNFREFKANFANFWTK